MPAKGRDTARGGDLLSLLVGGIGVQGLLHREGLHIPLAIRIYSLGAELSELRQAILFELVRWGWMTLGILRHAIQRIQTEFRTSK
jgi:hypothetical protein